MTRPPEPFEARRSPGRNPESDNGRGGAKGMLGLMAACDTSLDVLSAEWLSQEGKRAVRSLRAITSFLRGAARELRITPTESDAPAVERQLSLAAWWRGMEMLLHAVHGDDVAVRADISPRLPRVSILPHHLTQVVCKLVEHAFCATRGRPVDDRGARQSVKSPWRCEVDISAQMAGHGRAVNLVVADNGAAMSPAARARILAPSIDARVIRSGSAGLGLAGVRRLIDGVGGSIHLDSVVGTGTTVTIELPTHRDFRRTPAHGGDS